MMLPLGIAELIEIYLYQLKIIKPGSRIKHDWLKRNDAKNKIEQQCISSLDDILNIDKILEISKKVELKRNDIAYGAPMDNENLLKNNIQNFFKILDLVESALGDKIVKHDD
ncbi:MAG: hypothetical protein KAK00_03070 [Nanoarchaeota archaeon]|nr:hypothetical protein [Nanoarchaeota archaeon]